jgi:hypothetical protein
MATLNFREISVECYCGLQGERTPRRLHRSGGTPGDSRNHGPLLAGAWTAAGPSSTISG